MLVRKKTFVYFICILFVLSSCTNTYLPIRPGKLVTQLYRQYKQEILLAYDDFKTPQVVDEQHGYAKAYFDNYRKQIIFTTQWSLDYLIGDQEMTTATEEISGYVSKVLLNERHQIGVETFAVEKERLGIGDFDGSQSRVIDLNTRKNVVLDGLIFSHCTLIGDYVYGFLIDDAENQFLDIIDVTTMEHTRIKTGDNEITFLYQQGDKVFAQSRKKQKTFLVEETGLAEVENPLYDEYSIIDANTGIIILKDIAPINSHEHWYVNPLGEDHLIRDAELIRFSETDVQRVLINFTQPDVLQIIDVANFGEDKIGILYQTRVPNTDDVEEFLTVYDLNGKELEIKEISDLYRGDVGRITWLDYLD